MTVVFGCPHCGKAIELEAGTAGACGGCGGEASLAEHDGALTACLGCNCDEVYRHRDFNPKVGLFVIALGAVLCLVLATFWPLVIAAALDLLLYFTIPDVAICYRCKAHHRDFDGIEGLPAFDLERFEHYRFVKAREEGRIEAKDE